MSFIVKKFISQFLMPVPLVFELFLIGWLLMRLTRFKRIGRCLTGCAIVVFLLFGYGVGAERYLYHLERSYPPVELDSAGFASLQGVAIVVLGQGFPEKSDLPLRYQTGSSFQQRLQEGVRLYRKIPDASLFVSLAGDVDRSIKERFIDGYAREHDLKRAGIHLIPSARDTADEARMAIDMAKTNRLVVVTSATHLPRAVKIFSKEFSRRGMPYTVESANVLSGGGHDRRPVPEIIPAPCDYLCPVRPEIRFTLRLWDLPLPSADGFGRTQHAFYEWLGNLHEDLTD